jgi:quercetin dioxygenase-like cupin family protein
MTVPYTRFGDLAAEVQLPANGILSRAIFDDRKVKAVLFGFAVGEELSEHTASTAAIIHILQGEAVISLGDDTMEARAGAWIHMSPSLPHSIRAKTPLLMLLTLLKQSRP